MIVANFSESYQYQHKLNTIYLEITVDDYGIWNKRLHFDYIFLSLKYQSN